MMNDDRSGWAGLGNAGKWLALTPPASPPERRGGGAQRRRDAAPRCGAAVSWRGASR